MSQADFDSIARVYHQGTPYAMPHTMFVIDRRPQTKFITSIRKNFAFTKIFCSRHISFRAAPMFSNPSISIRIAALSSARSRGKKRSRNSPGNCGKAISQRPSICRLANELINKTFFQKVFYKPNSIRQEDVSANIGIERILQDELNRNQVYLALNTGTAVGRLHVIDKLDDTVEIGDNEILVLRELPLTLPPVRGIIVAQPSTPLSHINILARAGTSRMFISRTPTSCFANTTPLFSSLKQT